MNCLKEFKDYRLANGIDGVIFWKLMQFFADTINQGKMTNGLEAAMGQEINTWNKELNNSKVALNNWLSSEINY